MIFVDTGAWIAISNPRDQHHHEAVTIYNDLRHRETQLLTTDYVIDETITRLRYDENHRMAVLFLRHIEHLETVTDVVLVAIDNDLFEKAKALFRQYNSARLSFTDCTSFVVCQENNIREAFAFDQHFPMMGIDLRR
ncbi:MAG: PIN domain-containing protein [Candidatus Poribacteria bacterium]|nr:PIN domain-containing protein [Candidatus Poribacteria bacterium]